MSSPEGDPASQRPQADTDPVRVVFDTSVLLRYLIKPSAAIRALVEVWWIGGRLQMVTAPELLAEIEQALERPSIQKFVRPAEGKALVETMHLLSESVAALGPIPVLTRDPKDDKFIACALAGSARFVVTTDEDLLIVEDVRGVKTVTPYQFLRPFDPVEP